MLETEKQRRWWFATHPEYRGTHSRRRKQSTDGSDKDSDKPSPEAIDAYVDEYLEHERDPFRADFMRAVKYWFGTDFEALSPEEQQALLWDDDEDDAAERPKDDKPSGHPAASKESYLRYEDSLDSYDARAREIEDKIREEDSMGLEADPHTFLDLFPFRRIVTAPIRVIEEVFRRTARGTVLNAVKKGGKRWKVGDDPLSPTPKGVEPSWTTQARRHWKNEAAKEGAAERWSPENLERMKKGLAPQKKDRLTGEAQSRELHHTPKPRRDGGKEFIEVWPEEHAAIDDFRRLKKR